MLKRIGLATVILALVGLPMASRANGRGFTPIKSPLSLKLLRRIGKAHDISEVEKLVGAKAPADSFEGQEGQCADYKFIYGDNMARDHVTVQACDSGYFYVNGISHDGYSLSQNNRGVFDCHLLFGGGAAAESGDDSCPR